MRVNGRQMHSNSYALDARVVVQHRGQVVPLSGPFAVGLLRKAPTPEGAHVQELEAPGYLRVPVEFDPPAAEMIAGARRSAHRVSFGPIGPYAAEAKYGAVFRGDEVIAYGLTQTASGFVGPDEIAFERGALRIRF